MFCLPAAFVRMCLIIRKELLVLFCNRTSRMMLIVPPLAQIVIFGWAATLEVRNVTFAVLDHDHGYWSSQVIHGIAGSPTFTHLIAVENEQQLRDTINTEKALFGVVFDASFSRNVAAGIPASFQLILDGRKSNASQIAAYYISSIVEAVQEQIPTVQKAKSQTASISTSVRCWFNPNLEFQWFFLPNLIGMLSFVLGLIVTGLSVAREREACTFDQLLVSPASPTEIALAKLVPGCIIGLSHGTIFIFVSIFGFGVPFEGSLLLLYVAILVFALASGAIGLMISSIASTQQQAFLGAFTVAVPCILLSGSVTPVINMPPFFQALSKFSPLTYFTTLSQGCFVRDITTMSAMLCLGKIALICAVCVFIAVNMFRRRT